MLPAVNSISNWADCWFTDTKRSGYTAVTDFIKQNFYGANEVNKLQEATSGKEDVYMSLNAFGFGNRRTENLKQIRNIGIDIDQYKLGYGIAETLFQLQMLVDQEKIPKPNLVLKSRGIQIFYTILDGASPKMGYLVNYVTDQLIGKLKHLGADTNAKDLSRVMRVPYSINSRNGSTVEPQIWNHTPYTLQELQSYCKPMETFSAKKVKRFIPTGKVHDKQSFFYRTNNVRLLDLEKLIEIRKGDFTHKRNIFLYVYGFHQTLICKDFSDTEYFLSGVFQRIHSKEARPMKESEFRHTVRSAYKDAERFLEHLQANDYRIVNRQSDGIVKPYTTANLIELLEITEDEQRALKRMVGKVVSKEKDTDRKRSERRAAGMGSMEDYNSKRSDVTSDRLEALRRAKEANPKATQRELAELLSISQQMVSKLLKQLK